MAEAFLDEPSHDEVPIVELHPEPGSGSDVDPYMAPTDMLFFPWALDQIFSDPFPDLTFHQQPNQSETEEIDPALRPTVDALASLHNTLTATDPSYAAVGTTAFVEALAASVFSRANRDILVATYFRFTHHHLPLLHRPSFNPQTSTPAVVLAVFLCGALYAPPRDSILAVRRRGSSLFPLAEEYVFRQLEACIASHERRTTKRRNEAVGGILEGGEPEEEKEMYETFQAALLVHGAQFLMNDPAARSAAWMARRPALVDAARRLGLTSARHTQHVVVGDRVDWERWVRDETRIRIANWTFLADWQQGGVLHTPGLATIHEMTADLPSLSDLWEANNAAEFEFAVRANGDGCWRRSASLRDCTDALVADAWSGVEGFPLKNISCLDHLLLVSAIHVMIGYSRLISLLPPCIPVLHRAIDRWEELWHATTSRIDDEQLRTSGFFRHCGEYAWLARALLKHSAEGKDRESAYYQRIGHDTPKELHDLLRELKENDNMRNEH
ncbi:hypothetical protein P885DRAFT_70512 [Corynascus similis CBS 632.67]